MQRLIQRR